MLKKKMFFALTIFVIFFTMIAWKVAVDELAELRKQEQPTSELKILTNTSSSKI